MSLNPSWQISLARTENMKGIDLLPYPFTFTPTFNRPGSFTMTMPLDDDVAYKVEKHATCVVCERNELTKWSGSIVSVTRDPAAMTLSLTAIGWLDEFNHRFVRVGEEASLVFTAVTGGSIARTLVTTCNAQQSTLGTTWPTHMTFPTGQDHDTQVRTRSYKRSQSYGSAIQELVDIESGLDIKVDPETRIISTYPPTFFVDQKDVVFGYGVEPFNLANAPQTDDGSSVFTRISAQGANGVVSPADDDLAIIAQGKTMRENWVSLSDVSDTTIVTAYANAELVYSRYGQITYDLKPLPYDDGPRLYDDFELGDKVYVSISAGALQVDEQAVRVFSVAIEVDAQGNETISSIATSPQ